MNSYQIDPEALESDGIQDDLDAFFDDIGDDDCMDYDD